MLGFDLSLTTKYHHFENDFIDMGKIGAGGFAQVHKVQSKLDSYHYALKIIEIKMSQCKSDIIQTMHRFLDQVKILSYLNHKNIIQYHGCWVQGEQNMSNKQIDEQSDYNVDINNNDNEYRYNRRQQPNNNNIQGDEQIVMVMQQQFSSSGIQFDYDDNDNQNQNQNQKHNNQQINNNDEQINNNDEQINNNDEQINSIDDINNIDNNNNIDKNNNKNINNKIKNNKQKNRNPHIIVKNNKNNLNIPIDHSTASSNIRNNYKIIKIFILSQLCQTNIQSYLYKRNIYKQKFKHIHNNINNNNNINNININNKSPSNPSKINKPSFNSPNINKNKFINTLNYNNKSTYENNNNQSTQIINQIQQKDQLIQNYKMIIQIIQGLQYLHSKKVIHRDVKLHNIVIDKHKKCKIIDYGLAKKTRMLQSISQYPKQFNSTTNNNNNAHINGSTQQADQIFSSSVGTRIYSSPQQINSQKYDHRTDIYSLAIVILMFFCDFTTNHQQLQIIERIRKNDLQFIRCDDRLRQIMSRCLSEQKVRPRLCQVRNVVKILLRERYYKYEQNECGYNLLDNRNNVLQRQSSIYIIQNERLKKKMSKQQYLLINNNNEQQVQNNQQQLNNNNNEQQLNNNNEQLQNKKQQQNKKQKQNKKQQQIYNNLQNNQDKDQQQQTCLIQQTCLQNNGLNNNQFKSQYQLQNHISNHNS